MGEGLFDILGMRPGFNYKGHSRSSSNCGNFTGFLLVVFIGWAFYQVGNDIFYRESPNVITSKIFIEDPGQIKINPEEFIFALGLERPDNYAHYIDPGIFNVKAVHFNMKRVKDENGNIDLKYTVTDLETEVCRLDHFGSKQSMFSNLELSSLFCLKKDQPNLPYVDIKGKFEVDEVSFLRFSFSKCTNSTSNNTCRPPEDINFLLDGAYFAVYYSDTSIQPKNFSQPERMYMDAQFTTFGKSYFKEYQIWVGHNEISTDSGWLFDEVEVRESISFDFVKELLDFREAGDSFFEFQLRVSPFYNYYQRSYIKIQEILANVEGLLTVILVLVAILVLPYIKVKYYEELMGDVFDIHTSLEPKTRKNHEEKATIFENTVQKKPLNQPKLVHFAKESDCKKISSDYRKNSLDRSLSSTFIKNETKTENDSNKMLPPMPHPVKKNIKLFTNKPEKQSIFDRPEIKIISEYDIHASVTADVIDAGPDQILENENSPQVATPRASVHIDIESQSSIAPAVPKNLQYKRLETKKSVIFEDYGDLDEDKFLFKSVANLHDEKLKQSLSMNLIPEERLNKKVKNVHTMLEPENKKKLDLSLFEYFRSFFSEAPDLKKKMRIINEGKRRIVERLDVFNILKKLREVDKLKALLLNQEQLILFDYLPKPVIDYGEMVGDKSESLGILRDPEFVKIRQAVFQDAYKTIQKKIDKTEIDHKLIDIYDGMV